MEVLAFFLLAAIGYFIFAVIGLIVFRASSSWSYFVKVFLFGMLGVIVVPIALKLFGNAYGKYDEYKIDKIANEEVEFFRKTISGEVQEKEFIAYYKDKKLSLRGNSRIVDYFRNDFIASNLNTNDLCSLINSLDKNPSIVALLTFNPKIPDEYRREKLNGIVDTYGELQYSQLMSFIAKNKSTPPDVLTNITIRGEYEYAREASENTNALEIAKIIHSIRRQIILSVYSPESSQETVGYNDTEHRVAWNMFAKNSRGHIKYEIARHPNTPAEIFFLLANDRDLQMLSYIAGNKGAPLPLLIRIREEMPIKFKGERRAIEVINAIDKNLGARRISEYKDDTSSIRNN